jgi:hypothetical protein
MLKLGQVPPLRCSEAVWEGFEAEKTASQREHLSLTALGMPVSVAEPEIGAGPVVFVAAISVLALYIREGTSSGERKRKKGEEYEREIRRERKKLNNDTFVNSATPHVELYC